MYAYNKKKYKKKKKYIYIHTPFIAGEPPLMLLEKTCQTID